MTFAPSTLSAAADRLSAGPDPTWSDPPAWTRLNLPGFQGTYYQDMIATRLATLRKVSAVGPHGLGKTANDARIVLWFADTRERAGVDWKVVTTAGVWRQLQRYLWPEIHKWGRRLRIPLHANSLLTTELKLRYGQAFPVASDDPANIEGAHADEILYIIDEAKSVLPETWDAIEGAMSAGNAYCLASSTPGKAEGRLYEIHSKRPGYEDWETINVTLEDAISSGRIRREWAEARARQWGETSPMYLNRVRGEFSTTDSDGVIPLEWLEAANERWIEKYGDPKLDGNQQFADALARFKGKGLLSALAADVATEVGIDQTIISRLYSGVDLAPMIKMPHVDTMKTVGKVMEILQSAPPPKRKQEKTTVAIDNIGVGTGAVDRLRELGVRVDGFMGSGKPAKKDHTNELTFLNRRAESWWGLRDLLNPAFGFDIAIPEEPTLTGDLIAPKWEQTSTGHIKIEDKDETRKRLGRSPDEGDATVMVFNARPDKSHNLPDMVPVGMSQASRWAAPKTTPASRGATRNG